MTKTTKTSGDPQYTVGQIVLPYLRYTQLIKIEKWDEEMLHDDIYKVRDGAVTFLIAIPRFLRELQSE